MLESRFDFMIFLLMIFSSGVLAQTTPELILPEGVQGTVKLNISTISNQKKESLGYKDLAVFVKSKRGEDISNAIQGQYIREGEYLHFKPYFPFESGMTYLVKTKNTNSDSIYFYQSFQIGTKKRVEEAKVVSIYPSSIQLPENLLRFYIYFNTPMRKGEALKHIQLIDAEGKIDNHAFMEFKQELWSSDGKRLTVLFDPGRIKRGVSTNMQLGSALQEGNRYSLKISGAWQDVYGQPLSEKTSKEIEIVKPYRHHMLIENWTIDQPKANSDDTLTIHFDRIIDHALIQSMIKLVDAEDNLINGHWEILENERSINFISKQNWKTGKYQIIIDSRLEDISGNNLHNLLDHTKTNQEERNELHQVIEFKI